MEEQKYSSTYFYFQLYIKVNHQLHGPAILPLTKEISLDRSLKGSTDHTRRLPKEMPLITAGNKTLIHQLYSPYYN
jgi:hypothetical protein